MGNDSLNVYLTIEGTSIEHEEVVITNPNQPLSELISRIIQIFNLQKVSNEGIPIQYWIGKLSQEEEVPTILEFEDEEGRALCLLDHNIQPEDHLYVIPMPIKGYNSSTINPTSPTKEHEEIFLVYLTIEGTYCEDVGIQLEDPLMTLHEQINWIVQIFNLPKMDNGGYPVQYLIGRKANEDEELEIFEFYDNYGHELCLFDYNVQPGDHLHVISKAIAGGCPITFTPSPKREKNYWKQLFEKIKTRKQNVYSSIFAPTNVKPYSHMIVQVYLHLFEETEIVKSFAQESQLNAERRDYIPLQCKLKKGDKVDIQLYIYGETLLRSEKKSLIWQGSFTKCSFDYFVPHNIDTHTLSCCAVLSANEVLVGEMKFITQITEYEMKLNPEVYSQQYHKIFISYAHQDEDKVEPMARAYKAQGTDYFFDRHYLKPGDIFPLKIQEFIDTADLFILCWSENAAKSEYVELERQYALRRAFPQVQPIEEARLSIYPMSIQPRAELPVDMKDTYNFEIV